MLIFLPLFAPIISTAPLWLIILYFNTKIDAKYVKIKENFKKNQGRIFRQLPIFCWHFNSTIKTLTGNEITLYKATACHYFVTAHNQHKNQSKLILKIQPKLAKKQTNPMLK